MRPKRIVLTPVRNEAWVLDAFLSATSLWADEIILADQMSTDGSREIAKKYAKVRVVDNTKANMDQAYARQLLFNEVEKTGGEKLLFCLDADEFLSGDFEKTGSWKRMNEPSDYTLFCFRWINLYGDFNHCLPVDTPHYEWAAYVPDGMSIADLYRECEVRSIHESRLPCTDGAEYVLVDDIRFIHLARLSLKRQEDKNVFYAISTIRDRKEVSPISVNRTYHFGCKESVEAQMIENGLFDYYLEHGLDIKGLVDVESGFFVDYVNSILKEDGMDKYASLDIWQKPSLKSWGDPRTPLWRLIHFYLRETDRCYTSFIVRTIDGVLKKLLK